MSTKDNSSHSTHERAELRAALIGLSVACPFIQDNPASCQLCQLRTQPIAERLQWVSKLSMAEMRAILEKHQKCLCSLERGET